MDEIGILAGEGFIEASEERDWTEILTPQRLVSGLKAKDELEQIQNFVGSFNSHAGQGETIELDQKTNDFLFEQLRNKFHSFSTTKPEELHSEPLFILALKFLLERKIEQWALRRGSE